MPGAGHLPPTLSTAGAAVDEHHDQALAVATFTAAAFVPHQPSFPDPHRLVCLPHFDLRPLGGRLSE